MRWSDDSRVIVGCLIAGGVGGAALATTWQFKPEKDFWDILSALGTMAAVVVALLIASIDWLRRRRESTDRAELTAARIGIPLLTAALDTRNAESLLDFYDDAEDGREEFIKSVKALLTTAIAEIETEDLLPLVSLKNGTAHRIARAIAMLRSVKRAVEAQEIHYSQAHPGGSREFRVTMVWNWSKRVMQARWLLEVASKECLDAGERGAPFPAVEEIYGDP